MAKSFLIGDTGEEFIVATWRPDPEELEAELLLMADEFANWAVPLAEAKQAMISSTRRRFEKEDDPYGMPWVPLDEIYELRKANAGFPDQILVRTGEMEQAATSEEAWFVTESSIFFRVEALPKDKDGFPYGAAHQAGTGPTEFHRIMRTMKIGKGGVPILSDKQAAIIRGTVTDEGSGRNLPQRQFIGADDQAIGEIEAIFLNWINKTIEGPWGGDIIGGGVEPMGENILGFFPIIGFTKRSQPILKTPHGPRFGRK